MISTVVRTCFPVAAKVVADRAEEINKLNVFPVPDGDTGTNMSLTLNTVVREVEALPLTASMDDVSKAITHGSLMGARGNSGVITSQILRGIAEGLCDAKDPEHATPADVAHAFRRGVKVAFKAVRKPVEGTILTVLRDVSTKADQLEKTRDLATHDMLDALVVEAYESVARTPELLPVLKENGVVDSGAFGFAVFMEAFVNAATGKAGELTDFKTTVDAKADVSAKVQIELNDDWEGSEFRYCNEFLFKAEKDFDVDESLAYLATLGDCELIVGAYPDFKVHVHSNEPNRVLEYMLQFGQVYEVFIHNMDMESHDRTAKIAADQAAEGEKDTGPRKALGFVAVAAGSGEGEILRSLGVDVVVSGGQTMNPSTADILEAIESANADNVIVLPGNGNIRMAAEAAASACEDAHVAVVPTKTVLQGFSAMFAVDPEGSLEDNVEAMTEAIQGVRGGEVTTAVRDSQAADGTPIHDGDVMGIQDDSIDVVGSDVAQVTLDLIAKMQDEEEGDSLTILAGQDMDDEAFEALVAAIEEAQPDLEVDPHRGEQPLYPVIFSIE
ncbi:MAG TPA: DAK2 domain-containing protein [Candidatus Olsenella excrementavium]|uniref:DAK2 domain-containing protein n=1 Tax=Candidatus Olsenella excrementavium TaxID=2838709 RepID=A0A9D2CGZ6_9ACTN|nr:DAK2 domain-containing protein [Candidatus Olsenella excrementavium]